MAKKDEKNEVPVVENPTAPGTDTAPAAASETPNRDKWFANMRGKYGEDLSDEDLYAKSTETYDAEHEANKRFNAETATFAEQMSKNPNLASVFSGILEGTLTDENFEEEPSLAGYAAQKKRKDEEAAAEEEAKKEGELDLQAFEEICKEDGIDNVDEVVDKLVELESILKDKPADFEQRKSRIRSLLKMVTYDTAVAAAEVRGRNANIAEQRRSIPKTTPQGGGAGVSAKMGSSTDIFGEIANSAKKQRDKYNA